MKALGPSDLQRQPKERGLQGIYRASTKVPCLWKRFWMGLGPLWVFTLSPKDLLGHPEWGPEEVGVTHQKVSPPVENQLKHL